MNLISYAQNFEDIVLWRALHDIEGGVYLDIGAQHPVIDSVSHLFFERNWRGIHVEANPHYAALLRRARPGDQVIEALVGEPPKDKRLPFFIVTDTGLSTGIKEVAERHRQAGFEVLEITAPVLPLSDIFLEHSNKTIHWMKIDVEGMEAAVLRSWDRSPVRPWILTIESTLPNTRTESHHEWINLVLDRGYREVWFDGLSRFFLHEDQWHREPSFKIPPNIFDGFSITQNHFAAALINQENSAKLLQAAQEGENKAAEFQAQLVHALEERDASFTQATALQSLTEEQSAALITMAARHMEFEGRLLESRALERRRAEAAEAAAHALWRQEVECLRNSVREAEERIDTLAVELENRETENSGLRLELISQKEETLELSRTHAQQVERMRNLVREAEERLDNLVVDLANKEAENSELRLELISQNQKSIELTRTLSLRIEAARQEHEDSIRLLKDRHKIETDKLNARTAAEVNRITATFMNDKEALLRRCEEATRARTEHIRTGLNYISIIKYKCIIGLEENIFYKNILSEFIETLMELKCHSEPIRFFSRKHISKLGSLSPGNKVLLQKLEHNSHLQNSSDEYRINGARSVPELMQNEDIAFVEAAYRAILGREADDIGKAHYLEHLRKGKSKLYILRSLRKSQEAIHHIPGVAGLDSAIRRYEQGNWPIFGALIRKLQPTDSESRNAQEIRRIENGASRLFASLENQNRNLVELSAELDQALAEWHSTLSASAVASSDAGGNSDEGARTLTHENSRMSTANTERFRQGLAGYFQSKIWNA